MEPCAFARDDPVAEPSDDKSGSEASKLARGVAAAMDNDERPGAIVAPWPFNTCTA
jgi:hypothetical protein